MTPRDLIEPIEPLAWAVIKTIAYTASALFIVYALVKNPRGMGRG